MMLNEHPGQVLQTCFFGVKFCMKLEVVLQIKTIPVSQCDLLKCNFSTLNKVEESELYFHRISLKYM